MFDFRYYINLTEAAYDGLVARLKRQHSDQHNVIDQQLAWTKSIFAKGDQITWYLKIIDAYLKHQLDRTLLGDYQFTSLDRLQSDIGHYFGYQSPQIRDYQFGTKTVSDVVAELNALERKWQAKQDETRGDDVQEGDYPLFEFADGTKWWFINRAYCSQEGRSGRHCGNVVGHRIPDQRILSLRNSQNQVILTFILEPNKTLGEMKAKANNKPDKKYHPHIMQLLLWPQILPGTIDASDRGIEIAGISGQGYVPDANFSVFDLDQKQIDLINQQKPSLIKDQIESTPYAILDASNHIRDQYTDVAASMIPELKDIINHPNDIDAWIQHIQQFEYSIVYLPQKLWSKWPEFEDRLIETIVKFNKRDVDLLLRAPCTISKNTRILSKLIDQCARCIRQIMPTVKNYQELALSAVSQDGQNIYYVQDPSEQIQMAAIQQDPTAIQFIDNPCERAQLAAVNQNPNLIRRIKNPSEQVQLVAINKNPVYIEFIKNPSERVQLAAVRQNGDVIYHFVNTASEQVQLVAVRQNPDAIRWIDDPSEQVQLTCVKIDGLSVAHLRNKNPSQVVQLAAVKQNSDAIQWIDHPSEQVQLAAVNQDFRAIKWINNPNEQVQLAAVSRDGYAISYLKDKNPSEQVQMVAVRQNPDAIRFIKSPSEQVQKAANKTNAVSQLSESRRVVALARKLI